MANEITHVANASRKPIRIYYSKEKMEMEDLVVKAGTNHSNGKEEMSGNISSMNLAFKLDSKMSYIRVPVKDYTKIMGEGNLYVSVFVECCDFADKCVKIIAHNFRVPSNRSIIVIPDDGIHFQKYGANIWEDEDGNIYNK